MNLIYIIVAKGKIFNYILLSTLKLFFTFYALEFFNVLKWHYTLTFITLYIMSLLPIIYISSIFKLFLLLWSPLKCLSLLKSLVWPLLPRFALVFLHVVS